MLHSSLQAAAEMGQTLWLCQSRDKRGSWLPGEARGPSAQGYLQRHLVLQGCEGSEFTARGSLGSTGFTASAWTSMALGAVSPEGEACFSLNRAGFPGALASAQPHLYPNPANPPLSKEECPISTLSSPNKAHSSCHNHTHLPRK